MPMVSILSSEIDKTINTMDQKTKLNDMQCIQGTHLIQNLKVKGLKGIFCAVRTQRKAEYLF